MQHTQFTTTQPNKTTMSTTSAKRPFTLHKTPSTPLSPFSARSYQQFQLLLGGLLEVSAFKLGDLLVLLLDINVGPAEVSDKPLEVLDAVGSHLLDDTGEKLLKFTLLAGTVHDSDTGVEVSLNLGLYEVENLSVLLEEVGLLDAGDGLDTKSPDGSLELLVVSSGGLHGGLLLAPHATLTTSTHGIGPALKLGESLLVHFFYILQSVR
mmetsp:Transcript_2233/g.4603  ORF Transcript_2233/g.4603 Transcript_2233/m.4603 type:complete len:209 (+) Transcript_2233:304-930(+)